MSENLRCGLLPACAGGVLILLGAARCLAEPPVVKKAPEGFKNLSHLVTVRCGTTPITDEKARKLVRVVTPDGRGFGRILVEIQGRHWCQRKEFRTDEDGLAEVKTTKGNSMTVYAGSVHVWLRNPEVMRFPVEVVLAPEAVGNTVAPPLLGEKKRAPEGFEDLRHVFTAKTGAIPIKDKDARKLVRMVDQDGRGVKDVLIETMIESSKERKPFRTDADGVAEVKGFATFMSIDAGQAELLLNTTIRFPIEVTVSREEKKP